MLQKQYKTHSAEETKEITKIFLEEILQSNKNNERALLVCLWGDLGAGKTTFSQGLISNLGFKGNINSPTFVIMKKYILSENKKYKSVFHFDLYRINSFEDLYDLGWEEIINDKNNIVLIEWPEKIEKVLPENRIDIRFNILEGENREIIIEEN